MKTQLDTLIYRERSWFLLVFFLLFFTVPLFNKDLFAETRNSQSKSGNNGLRPVVGTRGLGLSHAFISTNDDATSPLWNPAGLASLHHGNLIYDFSQGAFSFAYPIKRIGTFGINFLDLNTSDRFLVDHISNPIGTFEYGYNQALLSFARKFGPLQFGASTGYTRAPLSNSLWAPNYDVGASLVLSPYVVVGMQYKDISGVSIPHQNGTVLQTFDQQIALGTTLTPHPVIRWHSCYNVYPASFGTSLELVTGPFAANIGSLFSFDTESSHQSWSLGLSFNKWGKQTYYTFLHDENLKYKHMFALGITFGGSQNIFAYGNSVNNEKTSTSANDQIFIEPKDNDSSISDSSSGKNPKTLDNSSQDSTRKNSLQIAKKHKISIELLLAIIYVESNFNPVAVSKTGAGGLMQLVPGTAREIGLNVPYYKNRLKPSLNGSVDERFDAMKNLEAGLIYFKRLLRKYENNLTLALGAYNVGPGRVRVGGPLISRGKIYAAKVLNRRDIYRKDTRLFETDLKRLDIILNR